MRIEVRGDNVSIPEHTRKIVEHKTRLSLGRIGAAIRNVRVVLKDLNGPRSGIDQDCSIRIQLNRGGEVHVSADDQSRFKAVDVALDRAARAATRLIERRQELFRRRLPRTAPDVTGG